MTELLPRTTVSAIVSHRDAAIAKMAEAVETLEKGFSLAEEARDLAQHSHGSAVFSDSDRSRQEEYRKLFQTFNGKGSAECFRQQVDARTWMNLMSLTGMDNLMDKTAKDELYKSLASTVPEVSEDNIKATFEHLAGDAKLIFQRGLARAFSSLDRRFKSHDAFKIGSRIILTNVFNEWGRWSYHSRMRDTLMDIERVFTVLDRQAKGSDFRESIRAVEADRKDLWNPSQSCSETEYFRIRGYKNGNAHLWFKREDLVEQANLVLAEYYGEVLPDAVPDDMPETDIRSKTGALSKDLAFYHTPEKVVRKILQDVRMTTESKVLEPSAGSGHMVRVLLEKKVTSVHAIEVHSGRVRQIESISDPRLTVQEGNFLRIQAVPEYTHVIMNPPFYGTHWMEHVIHAFDFLAPGGTLVAVLPVSAELGQTKKHKTFRKWAEKHIRWGDLRFCDLPAESFKDSGTRVNTVTLTLFQDRKRTE